MWGTSGSQAPDLPRLGDVKAGVFMPPQPHSLVKAAPSMRLIPGREGWWAVLPGGRETGVGSWKAGDLHRNGKGGRGSE